MIRNILLKKIACLAAMAFLSVAAKTGTPQQQAGAAPGSFAERLGADDGAALAILFTANMRGNLETCD